MKKQRGSIFRRVSNLFLKISFFALILISFFVLINIFSVYADSVTTAVTVGNTAPTFTAGPAENPASATTTPTNVGDNTTFQATATDSNSENYYLIVCSTNSVTAVNGGSPTCGATTWCTSTSTTSGSQASCNRTALIGDASSNAWYAFVCDGNATSAQCSTGQQGTGDSGSPFEVNHAENRSPFMV